MPAIERPERAVLTRVLRRCKKIARKNRGTLTKRIKERQTDDTAGLLQLSQVLYPNDYAAICRNVAAPEKFAVTSGNTIHMVKVDDVPYFEAADKHLRVSPETRLRTFSGSLREMPSHAAKVSDLANPSQKFGTRHRYRQRSSPKQW